MFQAGAWRRGGPRDNHDTRRAYRSSQYIYRRSAERRVRREHDALTFINEVGFCFLFSSEGSEMPTLYEAIIGDAAPWTTQHDYETGLAWRWKDDLPIGRKCFYGKLLRGKPVLVSLDMFPYFYAVSGNYGDLDQYLEAYQDGKISIGAKQIYEALLHHGAMPTSELRRKANLAGRENARAFERGLVELQVSMSITKTAISDANRWHYCYVYDLLPRWLPDQVQQRSWPSGAATPIPSSCASTCATSSSPHRPASCASSAGRPRPSSERWLRLRPTERSAAILSWKDWQGRGLAWRRARGCSRNAAENCA